MIKEIEKWDNFQEPCEKFNIDELLNKVINVSISNTPIKLIVYHPYYRKIIYNKCKELNLKYKYGIDKNIPLHDDNTLVLHFACRKYIPLTTINWYSDLNSNGSYKQLESKCKYCNNILLSKNYYEENNCKGNNGNISNSIDKIMLKKTKLSFWIYVLL